MEFLFQGGGRAVGEPFLEVVLGTGEDPAPQEGEHDPDGETALHRETEGGGEERAAEQLKAGAVQVEEAEKGEAEGAPCRPITVWKFSWLCVCRSVCQVIVREKFCQV